jgi:hypothetical protein
MLRSGDHTGRGTGGGGTTSLLIDGVPAGRGSIHICDFSPSGRSSSPVESRILVSAAGAVASSLLHVALLTTAIWAGSQQDNPTHRPERMTARGGQVSDEIALQWVTIDEGATSRQPTPSALSPPSLIPIPVTAELAEVAAHFPEATNDTASPSIENDGDASARLKGQYLGQIDARIDRAWIRPRTPIGDVRFTCQVRIDQDAAGNVSDVVLEQCNGSPRWQLSLVHAIESASPLPAPSDPAVFAPAIHMSFQADPPDSGLTADQYEPESVANEIRASDRAAAALEALRRLQDRTPYRESKPSVIDLRIERPTTNPSQRPALEKPTSKSYELPAPNLEHRWADSSASDSREQQPR